MVEGFDNATTGKSIKLLALAKAECFSVRYLVAKEPVVVDGVKYYKILTANPIPGMPRNAAKK